MAQAPEQGEGDADRDRTGEEADQGRQAGQLAVELEREDEAIQAWSRAVLLAGQDPEAAGMSSMSELSRLLARTLRGRGLHEQASAIEASIEASTQAPPMPATALDAAAGGQ